MMTSRFTGALLVSVLVLGSLGLGGCTTSREAHAATEIDSRLVGAGLGFGLSLHRQVAGDDPGENIFISPASVAMALHMTLNGAAGTTRDAMINTLELEDMTGEEINRANADLLTLFTAAIPGVDLALANSLWARQGVGFRSEFLAANEEYYRATVQELDFDDPSTLDTINSWVKDKTRGLIDEIIEEIEDDAVLFLINALYFKGDWAHPFDPDHTRDQVFYAGDGTEGLHPMMVMSQELRYLEHGEFQAVRLPYGDGRMSMYVFLPVPGAGLGTFYDILTPQSWAGWMSEFQKTQVDLSLPRFRMEFEIDLAEALKALGMDVAFRVTDANFENMRPIPPNLFIGSVNHRTVVDVTEEGTEAAAATSVEIKIESAPLLDQVTMVVDRPFFFAIQDDLTGALLFTGSVVSP